MVRSVIVDLSLQRSTLWFARRTRFDGVEGRFKDRGNGDRMSNSVFKGKSMKKKNERERQCRSVDA
jgi:hypothetical protein